jgi:hypothetical protein
MSVSERSKFRLCSLYTGMVIILTASLSLFVGCTESRDAGREFRVSISRSLSEKPITGRVYVFIFTDENNNPRLRRGFGHQPVSTVTGEPFFAVDVHGLMPGEPVHVGDGSFGYPLVNLQELPAGDYFVQALLNIYTEFRRSDGHVVWAHMDQWEGQQAGKSPGNLISSVKKVTLDSSRGYSIKLELNETIPPIDIPPDTQWIKRVKIQSRLLTEFWGHPIFIGATLLLPKDYGSRPGSFYPTVYSQGHFSLDPPFGFSTEPVEESESEILARKERGIENGFEFYESWISEGFPRMIVVTFQHPTPYFDDSYAVNSANNGPYGDALVKELIPYLEKSFRMIPKSYARILTGGSTGGYESLALQIFNPQYFGGTWTFYPDPIDFNNLFLVNIYRDDNAFSAPGYKWLKPERYAFRSSEGQPIQSIRQLSQLSLALGSNGRSCEYLEAWEAAFGPVGKDGYPKPLWDKITGAINRDVAFYWEKTGFDLVHYLRTNWSEIGDKLVGKINLFVGDMDNYYFNLPVYSLEEFLQSAKVPLANGLFMYGRPLKGHGWRPMNIAKLLRNMAIRIKEQAVASELPMTWEYK